MRRNGAAIFEYVNLAVAVPCHDDGCIPDKRGSEIPCPRNLNFEAQVVAQIPLEKVLLFLLIGFPMLEYPIGHKRQIFRPHRSLLRRRVLLH